MTDAIDDVAQLVARETGIVLAPAQHPFLQAAVARATGGGSPEELLADADDPTLRATLVARLVDEVTIKETSFLRDRLQLESIDWTALQRNAASCADGTIRVWSAACSTGEEPYTLALLACEAFGRPDPPVSILATDVSSEALRRALEGRYGMRAVQHLTPQVRERWLPQAGDGRWEASTELRALVRFARHNLIHDPFPPLGEGPFDLVLCRNVLIYFEGDTVDRVVAGLERSRRGDGRLVLGAADALVPAARRLARMMSTPSSGTTPPRAASGPAPRSLRRPLGEHAPAVATAVAAAADGHPGDAILAARSALATDPTDADAHFVFGLAELERGDPLAAVRSFRRALHFRPAMSIAAFELGRAADATGDLPGARSAYEQALRTLDETGGDELPGQIDPADIAAACRTRLALLDA